MPAGSYPTSGERSELRASSQRSGSTGLSIAAPMSRRPASASSISAVSAIATPVRCTLRDSKSLTIASSAASYRGVVVGRERRDRLSGPRERVWGVAQPRRPGLGVLVVARDQRRDRPAVVRGGGLDVGAGERFAGEHGLLVAAAREHRGLEHPDQPPVRPGRRHVPRLAVQIRRRGELGTRGFAVAFEQLAMGVPVALDRRRQQLLMLMRGHRMLNRRPIRVCIRAMKTLNRRVALITGASGGIGQAIARGLATEGAAVALGYGERCRAGREAGRGDHRRRRPRGGDRRGPEPARGAGQARRRRRVAARGGRGARRGAPDSGAGRPSRKSRSTTSTR